MSKPQSQFRDFGILPEGLQPPTGVVRAYFSTGQVIGQYAGTGIFAAMGLIGAVVILLAAPMPWNFLTAVLPLAGFGTLIYFVGRHDYGWIELDGRTLRAKHLYTGHVIERNVSEVSELVTMVVPVMNTAVLITQAWLGRVKGVEIRFADRRTPLRVMRSDPAMRNAEELIKALLYRMLEEANIEGEIIQLDGKPLLKRLYRK